MAPGGETIHRQVAKRKGRVRPLVDRREVKSEGKSGFGGPEARSLPTIRQRPGVWETGRGVTRTMNTDIRQENTSHIRGDINDRVSVQVK